LIAWIAGLGHALKRSLKPLQACDFAAHIG